MSALIYGLSLGFSALPGCFGHCLPMLLFLTLEHRGKPADAPPSWRQVLGRYGWFLLGRLLAYLGVGTVVGLAGAAMDARGLFDGAGARALFLLTDVLILGFVSFSALRMLDLLPRRACAGEGGGSAAPRCATRSERAAAMLVSPWGGIGLGVLAGLSPCPPFLLAIGRGIQPGDAGMTVILFLGFYLATTLPMLLMMTPRAAREPKRVRTFAGNINLAIALLLLTRFLAF